MIVYLVTESAVPVHRMFLCPGADSDSVEFRDESGKPRQYEVVFSNGRAEVPDNLGRWMIDHGHAKSSSLIIPPHRTVLIPDGGAYRS